MTLRAPNAEARRTFLQCPRPGPPTGLRPLTFILGSMSRCERTSARGLFPRAYATSGPVDNMEGVSFRPARVVEGAGSPTTVVG